jgi:hypothetical protein
MMHFNPIYSLIAAVVMIALYRASQMIQHGQFKWYDEDNDVSFWGASGWLLKYKPTYSRPYLPEKAPDNWYYRLIKSPYKERWFTSTWLTVQFTDGYHLLQSVWLKLFYLIIANHLPLLGSNFITDSLLWSFLVTWAVLGTVLWSVETILKR